MYAYFALFLIITISINYKINFEDGILDRSFGKPIGTLYFTLFYAFAYYGIAIPQQLILKRQQVLKTPKFWLKSFFFLLLIGFSASLYQYNTILTHFRDPHEYYFVFKLLNNAKVIVPIAILFIFKITLDKNIKGLYGLHLNKVHIKPYFIMLFIVFPLILGASFLPDFQEQYPVFKAWRIDKVFGLNHTTMYVIYEFFYGLSFLQVELLFRGALVIGMISILGKDAILPMAAAYAFLHFGKPLGETIGSIFGGYILGVIALRTKHIFGGYIIHVGVALLMEITAIWQHYR